MDTFKILIWDNAIRLGLKKLYVAVPFLGIWPISAIFEHFAFKLTDFVYLETSMFVDYQRIFFKNRSLEHAYVESSVELLKVHKAGDESLYEIARQEHQKRLSDFMSLDT